MHFYKTLLLASAAVGAFAMIEPAQAAPYGGAMGASGVCPDVLGSDGPQGPSSGSAADCNLIITFNADGSISTTGPGGNYEGNEDAMIGIVNNSRRTISSFVLSNPNIFGFDGDGIDTYVDPADGFAGAGGITTDLSGLDGSGYGGPLVFFTGINGSNSMGTINIFGGLGTGASTFFSLEEPANLTALPVITTPEPGTIGLVGGALAAVSALRRRKRKADKA